MPKTNLGKGLSDLARQLDPFHQSPLSGPPVFFRPRCGERLCIAERNYEFLPDPDNSARVQARQGRHSTVYRLSAESGMFALKVFRPEYRTAAASSLAFHSLALLCQGLSACRRTVLSGPEHDILLRHHPELACAVLMPWIAGPAWSDIIAGRRPLASSECLSMARALAGALAHLEEYGIAHGALCSDHLRFPFLQTARPSVLPMVELVDLEHMWVPGLAASEPSGDWPEGYAHRSPAAGAGTFSDRFSGALLLAEVLAWCEPRVRDCAGAGPGYFGPGDIQRQQFRQKILAAALASRWGREVADVFERSWQGASLKDCPSFGEWLEVLPGAAPARDGVQSQVPGWARNPKPAHSTSLMGILTAFAAAAVLAFLVSGPPTVTGFRSQWERNELVAGPLVSQAELNGGPDRSRYAISGGTVSAEAAKASTGALKQGGTANQAKLLKGQGYHVPDVMPGGPGNLSEDTRPRYQVWGHVVDEAGKGIPGVTILFSGGHGVAVTDEHGFWKSQNLVGTVHIVPLKPGWRFSPVIMRIFGAEGGIAISGQPSPDPGSIPGDIKKPPAMADPPSAHPGTTQSEPEGGQPGVESVPGTEYPV